MAPWHPDGDRAPGPKGHRQRLILRAWVWHAGAMAHPPVPDPTWHARLRTAWRRWRLQRAGVTLTRAAPRSTLAEASTEPVPVRAPGEPRPCPRMAWADSVDAPVVHQVQLFMMQHWGVVVPTPVAHSLLDDRLVDRLGTRAEVEAAAADLLMDRLGQHLLGQVWTSGQPTRHRPAQRIALQHAARETGWAIVPTTD